MTVIRLVKSRNPEPIIIGHDDKSSLKLQSLDLTNDVISLIDDNVDEGFISWTDDDLPTLSYIVKEIKQF